MSAQSSFLTHWYFHVPNLLMAAMIYSLIARYVLELIFARQPDAVMLHVFRTVTNPVVSAVRAITPAIVPGGVVIIFAVVWLFALRIVLFWGFRVAGFRIGV
jgi:YggT family protein